MLATNSLDTPVIGLVGRSDGQGFDATQIQNRIATANWPQPPAAFGFADEFAVLGSFIAGPQSLTQFLRANHLPIPMTGPVVSYRAPRITYAPDSLPRDRLIELLQQLAIRPSELLGPTSDTELHNRLGAYWAARSRYIQIGRDVRPVADIHRMLEQVREPLLSVLRISPDFRPAYDPLVQMAGVLGATDVPAARQLLRELAQLQPARPEAVLMLREIN